MPEASDISANFYSARTGIRAASPPTEIVLDMLNGGKLDWILTLATERFQVPQAFVALAAETVEETMNRIPLDRQEAEYVLALRNQTLETGDMLVMLDSHAEKVPSGALAAPAEPAIRFYAGAPLVLAKTEQIGTLILIDRAPHGAFSTDDAIMLDLMAQLAIRDIMVRLLETTVRIGRSFHESSSDAFLTSDPEGRILFWNRGAEQTFGYTAEEAIGMPLDNIIPQEHRGGHLAGMARLMSGGRPRLVGRTIEVPAVRKDGRRIVTELTLNMTTNPKTGLPTHFSSIIRDVGSRIVTEARVAGQLAAIEAAHDGIAIADRDGIMSYMNEAFLHTFGLPPGSRDVPWTHLIAPYDRKRLADQTFDRNNSWEHWHGEIQGLHSSGARVDLDLSLTLKGNTVVCVTRDMTARREAEREKALLREQLLVAQRQEAVGQLASGIAHDFNNLIAAISGSADMLTSSTDPNVIRNTTRIQAAARSATSLVEKMLSLGRRSRDYKLHDVRHVINDTADLLRVGLAKRQRILLERNTQPAMVMADRNELMQVLLNLGLNARDALGSKLDGELGMSVSPISQQEPKSGIKLAQGIMPKGPMVRIRVWDNGCGMDPAEIESIFKPFYSRKEGARTGLGLAMVAGILASAGAGLALNTSLGSGTSFDVFWPVDQPAEPDLYLEPHSVAHAKSLEGLTILVVDDELHVLETITELLELAGAEVGACLDPIDAVAALESDPQAWSVLITDYDMPKMNGAALAEAARRLCPDLPVLLVTALPENPHALINEGSVFSGVIGKPLSAATLAQATLSAIAHHGRGDQS